jgi:predicted alpha/beta-fold hydrolase
MSFSREKIFFDDGGHVSLDWLNRDRLGLAQGHPIVLVMHGVTGGSDCKYIRVLGE